MTMQIKKFVEKAGSCAKAAEVVKAAGIDCQQSKFQHVVHGDRPASPRFAVEIEAATKGAVQATDIMNDSLDFWRQKLGLKKYRKLKRGQSDEQMQDGLRP